MNADKTELEALRKICAHLTTVADKYAAKHKAIVAQRQALIDSGDYSSENAIMDAYGWEEITEEQKNMLLDALEAGQATAEADTVWSMAARILRRDIREYEEEISEIEYTMMTPAQRKARDMEAARFQVEQDERRKRQGRVPERSGE